MLIEVVWVLIYVWACIFVVHSCKRWKRRLNKQLWFVCNVYTF